MFRFQFFVTVIAFFNLHLFAQNDIIVDESLLRANPKKQISNLPPKKPTKEIKKTKQKKPISVKPKNNPNINPIVKPEIKPAIKQESKATESENSNVSIPSDSELILEPDNVTETTTSTTSASSAGKSKFKNKKAITIDYNTWYENLKIINKNSSSYGDSKAHYFGLGLYYDYTVYEEKIGYAISLGAILGNAQTGTVNTSEYYERRIPWLGYRAGGRLFLRANNRIDIGPALLIQNKETKWPEQTNYKVMPQSNPQYFIYLDTRWRLSYPIELIQSFGFHTGQYALVWRLGINYTLN